MESRDKPPERRQPFWGWRVTGYIRAVDIISVPLLEHKVKWFRSVGPIRGGAYLIYALYFLTRQKWRVLFVAGVHCKIKLYPSGDMSFLVSERPIFGGEAPPREKNLTPGCHAPSGDARRRARTAVRDLALSNDFVWFVTFTLDPSKIDRYDPDICCKKLNKWLDNQVQRRGLCYVMIPEYHKDKAIHFHGLFNDVLPVKYSGVKQNGHDVYNMPSWPYGFTTAIRLYGDRQRAVNYVCKYINKTQDKVSGRYYYSGGKLSRPEVQYQDISPDDLKSFVSNPVEFDTPVGRMYYTWISATK